MRTRTTPDPRWRLGLLALTACAQAAPVPQECPGSFADARPFDPGFIESLAGTYEVRVVPTSYGTTRAVSRAGLLLAVPESLRLYFPEYFGDRQSLLGQRLAGVWRYADTDTAPAFDKVSIDDGILYVGCRPCLDFLPDRFRIEHVGPAGFWGRWESPLNGMMVIMDSAGRELPELSGFYCAVRTDRALGFRLD